MERVQKFPRNIINLLYSNQNPIPRDKFPNILEHFENLDESEENPESIVPFPLNDKPVFQLLKHIVSSVSATATLSVGIEIPSRNVRVDARVMLDGKNGGRTTMKSRETERVTGLHSVPSANRLRNV